MIFSILMMIVYYTVQGVLNGSHFDFYTLKLPIIKTAFTK